MLTRLLGAMLIWRLELGRLSLDPQFVWALWRQRPAIEIVLTQRPHAAAERLYERLHLSLRLHEVYPF